LGSVSHYYKPRVASCVIATRNKIGVAALAIHSCTVVGLLPIKSAGIREYMSILT